MTKDQLLSRALTMAELAPDQDIAVSTLTGRSGQFSRDPPLAEPPTTYLEPTEALAFVLANTKRGVRVGSSSDAITPSESRETLILVTGRRTLCLVGQSDSDVRVEIPHRNVERVSYKSRFRGYRLVLETGDTVVRCWINPDTSVDRLADAAAFVEQKVQSNAESITGEYTPSNRGQGLDKLFDPSEF